MIKYSKKLSSRWHKWIMCFQKEKILWEKGMCLDMSTRWNPLYLMLNIVGIYWGASEGLGWMISCLGVKLIMKEGCHMKMMGLCWWNVFPPIIFYELNLVFSNTLYVTFNMFLHQILNVDVELQDIVASYFVLSYRVHEWWKKIC